MGACICTDKIINNETTSRIKLTQKCREKLSARTKMSQDEIDMWHEMFLREYPGGAIDEHEFREIFKQHAVQVRGGKLDAYCRLAFRAIDRDTNGKITFDEFLLVCSISIKQDGDNDELLKMTDFAFDLFDQDKSGKISGHEIRRAMNAIYRMIEPGSEKMSRRRANEILERFDADKDGQLNKLEFVEFLNAEPICRKLLIKNPSL